MRIMPGNIGRSGSGTQKNSTLWPRKKAPSRTQVVKGPVEDIFRWNDGLDVDNHAVMGKAFLDAMKGYILPDDNREWVRKVSHEFWENDSIQVEVRPYGRT